MGEDGGRRGLPLPHSESAMSDKDLRSYKVTMFILPVRRWEGQSINSNFSQYDRTESSIGIHYCRLFQGALITTDPTPRFIMYSAVL